MPQLIEARRCCHHCNLHITPARGTVATSRENATMSAGSNEDDQDSFASWGLESGDEEEYGGDSVSSDESFIKDMEAFIASSPNQTAGGHMEDTNNVIVQLPPNFSAGTINQPTTTTGNQETEKKVKAPSEAPLLVPVPPFGELQAGGDCALESLDVPVDGEQQIPSSKDSRMPNDSSECESSAGAGWSLMSSKHDTSGTWQNHDNSGDVDSIASSIDNTSTISGFDLISLGGRTQKQCQKCSFLNSVDHNICQGCFVALVANPNMTVDEQLAFYLQQQEEEQAFKDTLAVQNKRKEMHTKEPLLFRAQTLAQDLHTAIKACKKSYDASMYKLQAIPEGSLAILASRFIDCIEEKYRHPSKASFDPKDGDILPVKVTYCFSGDEPWRLTQMRQDGFPPNTRFGETPEAATIAFRSPHNGQYLKPASAVAPKEHKQRLDAIREASEEPANISSEKDQNNAKAEPPARLCWVVLIVVAHGGSDFGSQQSVPVTGLGNPTASVYSRNQSCQSLPLVSFDANMIHDEDFLHYVTKRVKTACDDFFYGDGLWPTATEAGTDEEIARALQASFYEEEGKQTDLKLQGPMVLQASLYKSQEEHKDAKATKLAALKEYNAKARKRNDAAMVDLARWKETQGMPSTLRKNDIIEDSINAVLGSLPEPEKE